MLPTALVQRFVLFCRSQCQPTLRDEACAVLKQHYLDERAKGRGALTAAAGSGGGGGGSSSSSTAPMELAVTPRYLQALIRVAEARAKVELRHEVTQEDAVYAVQLLQGCLDTFAATNGVGQSVAGGGTGLGTGSGGGGSRKRTQREVVIDLLKVEVVQSGGTNKLSHGTIIAACEEAGCKNPAAMLHQLNEFGVLLQCGDKYTLRGV